jgi:hypothetical protein
MDRLSADYQQLHCNGGKRHDQIDHHDRCGRGGGPTVIQGWNSMAACEAAKAPIEAFYKERHGNSISTGIETKCLEFANNP